MPAISRHNHAKIRKKIHSGLEYLQKIKVSEVTEQKRHGILGAVYQPVRAYRLAESPLNHHSTA